MLVNREELLDVLGDDPRRIGKVFARHAYGMRRWVDLFSIRVPLTDDPEVKQLLAEIVGANARHMNLFRARAIAHGVDPDAYVAPPEGEAIYERIEIIDDFEELIAYAAGSLDHFGQLLEAYVARATGDDAVTLAVVAADNDRACERLAAMMSRPHSAAFDAHELYRLRELVETGLYVG
ncbi:MAG: hypothetical protein KY463_12260 [Actinobacteria bacterium]|nr:hypothetical protein [Actinomycetota bacterium]